MEENDVQLIHKILSGDEEAFGALVRKHQKSVHALAWRKLGTFTLPKKLHKMLSCEYIEASQH